MLGQETKGSDLTARLPENYKLVREWEDDEKEPTCIGSGCTLNAGFNQLLREKVVQKMI